MEQEKQESTLIQDTVILDKIKAVWQHWKGNGYIHRSDEAMRKINSILERT